MRWGSTPSFLSSAGPCALGSRDEDVYVGHPDPLTLRTQPQGGHNSLLQPGAGGKPLLKPRPRVGKLSVVARSSCGDGGALQASATLEVAGTQDTKAIASLDLFAAPLLVCAGSGVLQGSNNSEQPIVDSRSSSISVDGSSRLGLQQGTPANDGGRQRSDRPTGSLIRSDSELEVIIQELRAHISQQNRVADLEKPKEAAVDGAVHQRRYLKSAVERVSQVVQESTPAPTITRKRPATGTRRTAPPLLPNGGDQPILIASAASFEVTASRSLRNLVVADSQARLATAQTCNDEAGELDVNQPQYERLEDDERHLVEGAVLNPRPTRVKPPVLARTIAPSKIYAAVRTPATPGSEPSRPRRERMRAHDYALAVDSGDDSSSDNSTDTETGSPMGPWVSPSDFVAEATGDDSHAAVSPTASVSASSSRSFYDEEIASLSPRSRLLWLSDFGVDDEGSGTRSASDLTRWRRQCDRDADRPTQTLARTKSCVNTHSRKSSALGQSRKPVRCASANPSRRNSGVGGAKGTLRRRTSESGKTPPSRLRRSASRPRSGSETSQHDTDNK
jgi:hypothetical protein